VGNRNGFTFLTAIFMVMIISIMSAFTGKTWSMIKKREREKELIFRGSQIKEAIENWNNQNFSPYKPSAGTPVKWAGKPQQLMNLEDLLDNKHISNAGGKIRYLPQHYDTKLDDKNPRCAPDCAKIKLLEDPITGKEWNIIRQGVLNSVGVGMKTGSQGGPIIGVASTSEDEPFRIDFKDTALENLGKPCNSAMQPQKIQGLDPSTQNMTNPDRSPVATGGSTGTITKYSEMQFCAENSQMNTQQGQQNTAQQTGAKINDHSKIYRAYHEGW
jgi:type II secretory pathway pseudopilin PulG